MLHSKKPPRRAVSLLFTTYFPVSLPAIPSRHSPPLQSGLNISLRVSMPLPLPLGDSPVRGNVPKGQRGSRFWKKRWQCEALTERGDCALRIAIYPGSYRLFPRLARPSLYFVPLHGFLPRTLRRRSALLLCPKRQSNQSAFS